MIKNKIFLLTTFIIIIIFGGLIFYRFFYLPNYHLLVNQKSIKDITISINNDIKKIPDKDWSNIIKEFNNSKMKKIHNLDFNSNIKVLFIFDDGNSLKFAINGNKLRISRLIGQKKVDYIAENPQIENITKEIFNAN
ncbi:hypothetical protein [Desulfosporosinus hippei]|uniref:Uncharacterized protein n=1 Tax=Desulfosporosinus hippei DSM 8344 TaxID=1121419 RepID=A0A1G8LQS8_9FIRM|nr:hypothetical protein [Desulfosporosinus hippei]SDI57965.1 hypothetical protein SAMN05443529_1532 [Desulfosporosinus hippei DSM 8344]